MIDHYETRCLSCGGSDEQGCYPDCPLSEVPRLKSRIQQLEARLRFWCKAHEAQQAELFFAAYESTRAALGEKK